MGLAPPGPIFSARPIPDPVRELDSNFQSNEIAIVLADVEYASVVEDQVLTLDSSEVALDLKAMLARKGGIVICTTFNR